VNVRLRKSDDKPQLGELFFDTEEPKVIGIDGREFFRGIFQSEGKNGNLGAFDVFGKIDTRAFDLHPRLFPWNDSGRVFQPVKNPVVNLLYDVIDSDGRAGILEAMTTMIAGGGRKQGAVGGQNVEAQKPQLFNQTNQGVKDLLIQGLSDTNTKVGESGLAMDRFFPNACQATVVLSSFGIVKNQAEVLDGSDSFEIAKQIEEEKGDGIIARSSEDGISIRSDGADEGKVDDGSNQLRYAAANGTVVVDVDKLLAKFVMRKPARLLFGKWFAVAAVDKGIDIPELSDKITDSKAGGFAHLKAPRVSRERLRPSKTLPGNPFLLVNVHQTSLIHPIQTKASVSWLSTNTGVTALRSLSCT
jgi:hypothetical protein